MRFTMINIRRTVLSLAVLLLAIVPLALAQETYNSPSNLVNLVRLINTAEALHQRSSGRYVGLSDLSHELQQASQSYPSDLYKSLSFAPGTSLMPGCDIRLIVASDGNSYTLLVQEEKDAGVTFYTDERGLIYQASRLQ